MRDILFEWNPWWTKQYSFDLIPRDKLQEIIPWIRRKEIVAVLGVRRSGKTTLIYEMIDYLINKKKILPKNIFFIKADDDRINPDNLVNQALNEYYELINPLGKIFLFIDEIQEIKNWQKTLKRLYDLNKNIKMFISGSNSAIFKKDLSSLLAGRFAYFELFPFSFLEFLRAKNLEFENEFDILKNKHKIRHFLIEYLQEGAFPEVVLEKRKKIKEELIRFYYDSIFYRDIMKRKQIRNPVKMENLVKYLFQNISNLTSFTKIAKLFGLTTDTVVEYIKALEDAYLIFPVNLFEFSYKKQIINPKKIYCIDSGIRNIVGFKFSQDIGRIYENIVLITLKRKGKEIYYWKNKNECDFVIKERKDLKAIQVCYNLKESKERELKGLLEFMRTFKVKTGTIITKDYEAEEKIDNRKIKFIPLWKWLVSN